MAVSGEVASSNRQKRVKARKRRKGEPSSKGRDDVRMKSFLSIVDDWTVWFLVPLLPS